MASTAAEVQARQPARRSGGVLSGSWHGVPKPLLAVGAGVLGFVGFKWWKNRSANSQSSTTQTTTPTDTTPATSSDTGTGPFVGSGGSGGGGVGGSSGDFADKIATAVANYEQNNPAPAGAQGAAGVQGAAGANAVGSGTGVSQGSLAAQATQTSVAKAGSAGAGGKPTGVAGTFDLPNGVLNFQPTSAIKEGSTVYYGIPTTATANRAKTLGGEVVNGKTLQKQGIKVANPNSNYLKR